MVCGEMERVRNTARQGIGGGGEARFQACVRTRSPARVVRRCRNEEGGGSMLSHRLELSRMRGSRTLSVVVHGSAIKERSGGGMLGDLLW